MILLIDNYDSFTYNLFQLVAPYEEVEVIRNDSSLLQDNLSEFSKIIISPGPGCPLDAGYTIDVIRKCYQTHPILGICLGHQSIAEAFGGHIVKSQSLKHGKTSVITHNQGGIFQGVPSPFRAMRYHSLIVQKETVPSCLEIVAVAKDDDEIMAIKHRNYFVYGLQFHPESFLTEYGDRMIRNFVQGVYEDERCIDKIITPPIVK